MYPLSRHVATATLLLATTTLSACATIAPPSTTSARDVRRLPPIDGAVDVGLDQQVAAVDGGASDADDGSTGKTSVQPYVTPERLEQGYTIVVVGVNGDNMLSAGLAPGLVDGGYPGAVEVVDWTTGYWPLFLYHLRASQRHGACARQIAEKIVDYESLYPGRTVNLVGYSAGAVVAVKALESLPAGVEIDRAVLLAGAISPLYNLQTALARSRDGIVSYSQAQDVVALWAGTLLAGTADGTHLPSAGAVGFWTPLGADDSVRHLYRDKLVQLSYKPQMAFSGNLGGHFQCVGRTFVAQWISPTLAGHPGHDLAQTPTGFLH